MNINTRADLDAIAGTPDYDAFLLRLRGTLTRTSNVAVYPDQYDHSLEPGAAGYVAPAWQDVEDLSVIERFGFTKAQILALTAGAVT